MDSKAAFNVSTKNILGIIRAVFACEAAGIFIIKQSCNEVLLSEYVSNTKEHIEDYLEDIENSLFLILYGEEQQDIYNAGN